MLKIGELSKKSGLSIRALRHYHDIELLIPSGYTESGYRLYSKENIHQLQHILLLKQLGLSLKEITELLNEQAPSLSQTIDKHILFIEKTIQSQDKLLSQLINLKEKFKTNREASVDDYLKTMEIMIMYDKYFNEKQRTQIANQYEKLSYDKVKDIQQQDWPELILKVENAMKKKLSTGSQEVQVLATQWMKLVRLFTQGDPKLEQSVSNMYKEEETMQQKTGIKLEMMQYISEAFKLSNN